MPVPKAVVDSGNTELFYQLLEEAVLGDFPQPLADLCEELSITTTATALRAGGVPFWLKQLYYDRASPGHNVFHELIYDAVEKGKNLDALAEACESMGLAKEVSNNLRAGVVPAKIRELHLSIRHPDLEEMTDEQVVAIFRGTPNENRERMGRLQKKATKFQKKLLRSLQGERRYNITPEGNYNLQNWGYSTFLRYDLGIYSYDIERLTKFPKLQRDCEDSIRIMELMGYSSQAENMREVLKAARRFMK